MMRDREQRDGLSRTVRRRRLAWFVALAAVFTVAVGGLLWVAVAGRDRRSADERLAEIEAARAIPDAENAAMIYNELLQDPNATSLSENRPESLDQGTFSRALREPWLSADHPELIGWIREHRSLIDRFLDASRYQECRFPIIIDVTDTSAMDRLLHVHQWGFLLSVTANNDIAEGRTDDALAKWQCLIQMGNHLRQQPVLLDHLLANSAEELAMESMIRFLVAGSPTEMHLQRIEVMPLPVKDCWAAHDRDTRQIEALISQKLKEQITPLGYLRHPVQAFRSFRVTRAINSITRTSSPLDGVDHLYRRSIANARGIRILVALRRYRDASGRWPESLDEIRSVLPEEILTDPFNKGPFVYKPAGDAFTLYSRGENDIDENGEWRSEAGDDWPIWPLRARRSEAETGRTAVKVWSTTTGGSGICRRPGPDSPATSSRPCTGRR